MRMVRSEECLTTVSMSSAGVDVGFRPRERAKLLILIGAILAFVGFAAPFVSFALLFLVPILTTPFLIPAIFAAIGALGSLLVGIGGFLIFLGFAQARQDSLPWTLAFGVVMVAAGVLGALAGGIVALLYLNSSNFNLDSGSLVLFSFVQVATGVALHAALIGGLLAFARTVLRKP